LDGNATTKVLPKAAEAAMNAMELSFGNPSSSHITGLKAKHIMEETRSLAAKVIGAGQGTIVFTSGATEGIQTAILSALVEAKEAGRTGKDYVILYGATEHKAVPNTIIHWNELLDINAEVLAIPVDKRGILDHKFIQEYLPRALLVCTMAVNNETGAYQNLAALNDVFTSSIHQSRWLVDCVQGLGKLDLDLQSLAVDYAPFSGHKLYAPKGIGWLYIKQGSPFTPVIAGGGQEGGLRSGTENTPGLAALQVILQALDSNDESTFRSIDSLAQYRAQLADALHTAFDKVVFNNDFSVSVPTTLNFAIPGFSSKEIMDLFDAAGIRVSSGSACSSKVTRSFVLDAMGLPSWQSESAIRMSFGPAVSPEEIDRACERIISAGKALQQSCLVFSDQDDDSQTFGIQGLLQLKHGGSCTWLYCEPESRDCVIIDPLPAFADRLDNMIRCRKLNLKAVVDTHGHADHTSCRPEIQQLLADVIPAEFSDTDELGWPTAATKEIKLADGSIGKVIKLGPKSFIKKSIPGHTDDSVAFFIGNSQDIECKAEQVEFAFVGDTILMGTLGRTNFSNSNGGSLYHSLQSLNKCMTGSTLICPAHDYQHEFVTNINTELQNNPLLKAVIHGELSMEEFVDKKRQLDANLVDEVGSEIMCGAYQRECQKSQLKEITPATLSDWIGANKAISIIDIREPHEHALSDELPYESNVKVMNIPLTRIVQFVADFAQSNTEETTVFICRSGSRSKLAASMFKRLGFENVTHVIGGRALS